MIKISRPIELLKYQREFAARVWGKSIARALTVPLEGYVWNVCVASYSEVMSPFKSYLVREWIVELRNE
jgi:hypothetical protein